MVKAHGFGDGLRHTVSRALHNLARTINQLVTEKRLLPQAPPLSLMLWAWALRLLGEIASHHARPDVTAAAAHYGAAMTLASELEMRPLVAHCHRGLGTLYVQTGQQEQARAELSTAIAMYQAMQMTFWLPQTKAVLAQVEAP